MEDAIEKDERDGEYEAGLTQFHSPCHREGEEDEHDRDKERQEHVRAVEVQDKREGRAEKGPDPFKDPVPFLYRREAPELAQGQEGQNRGYAEDPVDRRVQDYVDYYRDKHDPGNHPFQTILRCAASNGLLRFFRLLKKLHMRVVLFMYVAATRFEANKADGLFQQPFNRLRRLPFP